MGSRRDGTGSGEWWAEEGGVVGVATKDNKQQQKSNKKQTES